MEGFAPECAWVTMGGSEKLEERYCIRPTSETLFCEHYANIIHSHRDLPKLYNQWCSVLRWGKDLPPPSCATGSSCGRRATPCTPPPRRPSRRPSVCSTSTPTSARTTLAMPVVKGRKTDKEKFSGAEATYTVECMMHDKKALQAGTSHYFGDGSRQGPLTSPSPARTTSPTTPSRPPGGVSTRLIGGVIMTHGDNNGLVLPPRIAPTQGHHHPRGPAQGGRHRGQPGRHGPPEGRWHPGEDGRVRPVRRLEVCRV